MLSAQENALLTQTGTGTPMGDFVRRFWLPFLLAEELLPDGPPLRVKLLGECLVAFRATDGRVGLVDEFCPHRRAPIFFGRNEEDGLRCVYHGWKFDLSGACVDMPSEPPDSLFKSKVTITAYLVREKAGVLWAYLGPAGTEGEIPHHEWMDVPDSHRYLGRWEQQSNFVQAIEGELDSAHLSSLHQPLQAPDVPKTASFGTYLRTDGAPRWLVRERDFGLSVTARRKADDGLGYFRTNQYLLPCSSLIAPERGRQRMMRTWVPMDDESTQVLAVNYHTDRPISAEELTALRAGDNGFPLMIPGTHRPQANGSNDYLIDRNVQRTSTTTGIHGFRVQDLAMVEGLGTISDRTREHLGSSDAALIAMRRLLMRNATALRDTGEVPVAVRGGELFHVQGWSDVLSDDAFEGEQDRRIMLTSNVR
jgi:phenylpropionate dioxygenase-like ring-hydroxylating dioxygenase large terminal subunit